MQTETNYQFRERLNVVHARNRRNPERQPRPEQIAIGTDWIVRIAPDADEVVEQAACDLQDYLQTSQETSVRLFREPLDRPLPEQGG